MECAIVFSALLSIAAPAPGTGTATASLPVPTDHETIVGRLGVAYLGFTHPAVAGAILPSPYIPLIGVRYWFTEQQALTVGFGALVNERRSGGLEGLAGTSGALYFSPDVPRPGDTRGLAVRIAAPRAFSATRHVTVLLEPTVEYDSSFVSDTLFKYPAVIGAEPTRFAVEERSRGISLGLNAGAEVQLGFIDLPELAVIATVGASLDVVWTERNFPDGGANSSEETRFGLSTFVADQPWNIFRSSVAAVYYF